MSAMSQVTDMIAHSVAVPGYKNLFAYDENHDISYGYWICKLCKKSFFGGGEPLHYRGCSLKGRVEGFFTYANEDMIYVLGPKETGLLSPFKKEDIDKIKEIAKAQNIPTEKKS